MNLKRIFKLIKSELFMALVAFFIMSLFSLLVLVICSKGINKTAFFNTLKSLMFWFGYPTLVQPLLVFIYPKYDSDSSFYASAGIYYLGTILGFLFKSIIVGLLVSLGIGCCIIYNVYIKKEAAR